MTEEQVSDIAGKWMDIADTDGNGTISFDEFKDLITKLDDKQQDDKLKNIFEAEDKKASGELSVDQFGKALYESVKLMKHDDEEDN